MFGGNFAIRGWAQCDGQLLAISGNDALFSLLGAIYGGDGRATFGLPDLRGRLPVHTGTGAGLSERPQGQRIGVERVTLTTAQLARHNHDFVGTNADSTKKAPENKVLGKHTALYKYVAGTIDSKLASTAILNNSGAQSHSNEAPFQVIKFLIALVGIYPSRQ